MPACQVRVVYICTSVTITCTKPLLSMGYCLNAVNVVHVTTLSIQHKLHISTANSCQSATIHLKKNGYINKFELSKSIGNLLLHNAQFMHKIDGRLKGLTDEVVVD